MNNENRVCVCCNEEITNYDYETFEDYNYNSGSWTTYYICNACESKYRLMGYGEEHSVSFSPKVCDGEDLEHLRLWGFELETESGNSTNLKRLLTRKNFIDTISGRCAIDGSLSNGGCEFISNPMSEKDIEEHEKENIKNFLEFASDNSFVSHNNTNGRCGLHFHVSKDSITRSDFTERVWVLLETFKDEIKKLSRRTNNGFYYCSFMSDSGGLDSNVECDGDYRAKQLYTDNKDRYTRNNHNIAFNTHEENAKTYEFRFFRGTLKYESFMSSYEFLKNVVNVCDSDKELNDITWGDLCVGEFISTYVEENNLTDYDKHIIDTSKGMLLRRIKKVEYEEKILKILNASLRNKVNQITFDKSTWSSASELNNRVCDYARNIDKLRSLTTYIQQLETIKNNNNRTFKYFKNYVDDALNNFDKRRKQDKQIIAKINKMLETYNTLV